MTSREMKNHIMARLRLVKMTYAQLLEYTGLPKKTLTNHLEALKKFGFIHLDGQHGSPQRYYSAINMTDDYESVMKKSRQKRVIEEMPISPYATKVVTCNDYHTKGSKEKRSAWVGSTFGTMEY